MTGMGSCPDRQVSSTAVCIAVVHANCREAAAVDPEPVILASFSERLLATEAAIRRSRSRPSAMRPDLGRSEGLKMIRKVAARLGNVNRHAWWKPARSHSGAETVKRTLVNLGRLAPKSPALCQICGSVNERHIVRATRGSAGAISVPSRPDGASSVSDRLSFTKLFYRHSGQRRTFSISRSVLTNDWMS